jgi:glycosyltransferase involved in cell wall biosynthesis
VEAITEALRILSVGRLVSSKGHDDVIRAVAELRKRGHRLELHIGGDGPERDALTALAAQLGVEPCVKFLGSLSEEDYQAEMQAADLFVLASHGEPMGVVYMEAMASAVATIGTAGGGVAEIIDDGANGSLVPPRNPYALAEAMEKLLKNPELREAYGKAGREKAVAKFDSRVGAKELYRRLFETPLRVPAEAGEAARAAAEAALKQAPDSALVHS